MIFISMRIFFILSRLHLSIFLKFLSIDCQLQSHVYAVHSCSDTGLPFSLKRGRLEHRLRDIQDHKTCWWLYDYGYIEVLFWCFVHCWRVKKRVGCFGIFQSQNKWCWLVLADFYWSRLDTNYEVYPWVTVQYVHQFYHSRCTGQCFLLQVLFDCSLKPYAA